MSFLEKIRKFYHSDSFWAGLFRDVVFVLAVVAIFSSASQIIFGLWTPMVAVESESMVPHIQIGDIIFMQSAERTGIVTQNDGKQNGYTSFEDYGDVILYKPFGRVDKTPIIHRAMYYVEKGEPMWSGGPPAPHAGYITKGDNNPSYDQKGSISYLQPVKKEWITGVARISRIPILGCISLAARGNLVCIK
ncbi:MAG: S26 family signal peptidase [Candidatus Methanoperedens sp.]|nr:S26 family signal peptidase [Candidatus Methanoperedens sp.]